MPSLKKTGKYIASSWFAALILYLYIIFCYRTSKVSWKNKDERDALEATGESFTYLLWHNKVALCPYLSSKKNLRKVNTVVSKHGDGELLSKVLRLFGIKQIRGSSDKDSKKGTVKDRGGSKAIKEIRKAVKSGDHIAITPDGPRGPKYQIKDNLIPIAQVTKMKLVCFGYTISRAWELNSWDNMLIPKPFATIEFEMGKQFEIPKDLDDNSQEKLRLEIEKELLKLNK